MKKRIWVSIATAALIIPVTLINLSALATVPDGERRLLSHRGVYQHYDRSNLTNETCTAARIFKPQHEMLENTLASIKAAFDYGADELEIDVHPTRDGQFVVFHDWTVDCRTNGHGMTRSHTLAELKALDIGYGYTFDGGKTFPFRGRHVGEMPSLIEVLTTFPDKRFLINVKSNDPREADWLNAYIYSHAEAKPERLSAYGSGRPVDRLRTLRSDMKVYTKNTMTACGKAYMLTGWTGYFPKACRNTTVFLPGNFAPFVWGYPNRLQARFAEHNSYIYLLGKQKGKVGLQSVNTAEDYARVPESWRMGIMTDEIETVGPLVHPKP